jgi:hypothetical protein
MDVRGFLRLPADPGPGAPRNQARKAVSPLLGTDLREHFIEVVEETQVVACEGLRIGPAHSKDVAHVAHEVLFGADPHLTTKGVKAILFPGAGGDLANSLCRQVSGRDALQRIYQKNLVPAPAAHPVQLISENAVAAVQRRVDLPEPVVQGGMGLRSQPIQPVRLVHDENVEVLKTVADSERVQDLDPLQTRDPPEDTLN